MGISNYISWTTSISKADLNLKVYTITKKEIEKNKNGEARYIGILLSYEVENIENIMR